MGKQEYFVALWSNNAATQLQRLRAGADGCAGTELPRLPVLRHLNLLHCSALSDDGLSALAAQFPHLTSLQLKSPTLSDTGLAVIAALTKLERLDLVDCENLRGAGLQDVLSSLPRLHVRAISSLLRCAVLWCHLAWAVSSMLPSVLCSRAAAPWPPCLHECVKVADGGKPGGK